jgi:hypothetical protein
MSETVTAPAPPAQPARSRAATRQVWLDRLTRFPLSGLTPARFCAIEAVSLPSFYSWKRRFAAEALASEAGLDNTQDLGPRLLPVHVPAQANLELVLNNGLVLRIGPRCDLDLVRSLVQTLGAKPC